MSKETFKEFVRLKPELIKQVNSNKTSWQKLYEIYEIYGEDNNIWNRYVNNNQTNYSINEIINNIKNIDLNKLQSGIENLQNTISLIQGFSINNNNQPEQRYKYRKIDD